MHATSSAILFLILSVNILGSVHMFFCQDERLRFASTKATGKSSLKCLEGEVKNNH